jgi:hypothetical protein
MQLLPSLLSDLKAVCATFPDPRKGRGGNIAAADFGLSAFAMFFMQSASFLAYQRTLVKGPSAAQIVRRYSASTGFPPTSRQCGPRAPAALFERMEALQSKPPMRQAFGRLGGRTLVAWDGTEFFCSQKSCPRCLTRKLQLQDRELYILCCRRRSRRPAIPRSCR